MRGRQHYLWRAVDEDGDVIDILVQSRRDRQAAARFFRTFLKGQGRELRRLVTDKLRSYATAHRTVMPSVVHSTRPDENNRAEVSHQPTRQRERQMRRFKADCPLDQRRVSPSRRPARRGASTPARPRVRRALPSREKPSGTRHPAPATTSSSRQPGRERRAAGAPRRTSQFLLSRGRLSGGPINRTLRGSLRRNPGNQGAATCPGRTVPQRNRKSGLSPPGTCNDS